MTKKELDALMDTLRAATQREIAQLYRKMGAKDPFTDPKNHLLLPSAVKEKAILQIRDWVKKGELKVQKNV